MIRKSYIKNFGYQKLIRLRRSFKTILADAQEAARLAVIPGVFHGRDPREDHAFIQVLDGTSGDASYHEFPIGEFWAANTGFDIRIGTALFLLPGFGPKPIILSTPAPV
jgi:hypothetical protein